MELSKTFDKVLASHQGNAPQWLLNRRQEGFRQHDKLALPDAYKTKISHWNFTDLPNYYVGADAVTSREALPQQILDILDNNADSTLLVQINNEAVYVQLSQEAQAKGVIFTDIFTAIKEHGELVEQYYMTKAVQINENKLTALHAALLNGGAFLYVPKNVELSEAVQYITYVTDPNVSLFNHVLIVAEDNTKVTYIENYLSPLSEGKGLINIVAEVLPQNNAKVTYGAVNFLPVGFDGYINHRGVTAKDAYIEWALGLMDEGNIIHENLTNLMGDGSESDLKIVTVGRGTQDINFTSKIVQYGLRTRGHILKHGVMTEQAQSIFHGIGYIKNGACGSDAQQESRVLMLSDQARGDANPILIIDENDVTAGHAASAGRVDPLQLFYLMSRGLSRREAERLVIHGFLAPVVTALPIESVQQQLTQIIDLKVKA